MDIMQKEIMNVAARVRFEELGSNQGVQFNEAGAFKQYKIRY